MIVNLRLLYRGILLPEDIFSQSPSLYQIALFMLLVLGSIYRHYL